MLNKPSATGASKPRAVDPIFALIDKHRKLERDFDAACEAEDAATCKEEDAKAAAAKQWRQACNSADRTLRKLAATAPTSAAGVRAVCSYFARLQDGA